MAPRFPGFRFVPYGMPNPFPSPPVQSDSGGEQPPRPPSPLSGLLGLILKYEQWRQSILRDENKNLSTPADPQEGSLKISRTTGLVRDRMIQMLGY